MAALIELAGQLLALLGIAAIGFKIGERMGRDEAGRKAEADVADANTLKEAARSTAEAWRQEAQTWKSRHDDLLPTTGDRTAADKLNKVRALADRPGSIWFETPRTTPPMRPGLVVITVANLKGGVGKTTVSTHLAATLGISKKVLFLDLDFQGSGSTFLLRDAQRQDLVEKGARARVSVLLESVVDSTLLGDLAIPLGRRTPNVSVVPAYYPLADTEERLMLRWLIGDEPDDIRFNLRRNLHSDVLDFEVVVIDAPPRLSTAMAQALAASTHVLIPTQLEPKSIEATLYFSETLNILRQKGVNPQLNVLGVLPTMVPPEREVRGELVNYLMEDVSPLVGGPSGIWRDVQIQHRAAFRGSNLVSRLTSDPGARDASASVEKLAEKISRRIWSAA